MTTVGQRERATQNRVIRLFHHDLGYDYLGSWEDRLGNSNIEREHLRAYLCRHGYADELASWRTTPTCQAGLSLHGW